MTRKLKSYKAQVDALFDGQQCRDLWAAVIKQALIDAEGRNTQNKADLPAVLESQWWRKVCHMAGIDGGQAQLDAAIRSRLSAAPKSYKSINHHTKSLDKNRPQL